MEDDMYQFCYDSERQAAVQSMRRYYEAKPEQVKFFEEHLRPFLTDQEDMVVLDMCCGLGDLTHYLSQSNPLARFVCADRARFLLDEARTQLSDNPRVAFREADIYALSEEFGPKSFDLLVCKQTISWLPRYEDAIREMMAVTRKAVFLTSLFYDGLIDFNTRVREYATEPGRDGYNAYYNVYSFPRFREYSIANGAKDVVGFDFTIQVDLPRPATLDKMATYTVRLDSGERLQFSGAVFLPWKLVRIDL